MKLYWGPPPKRDSALVDARPWVRDLKKLQAYGGLAAMLVILPLAYVAWRLQWPDAVIFGVFREGP